MTESALPSASARHGMLAHVHNYNSTGVGRAVFAHAGNWIPLANHSELSSYLLSSAVSSYGATLIDDADAPTARTTLGLGTMAVETASDYLTTSSASSTYLTQSNASSTYLTQSSASSTYLTQSNASSTYLTQSSASSTYLTQSNASSTYLTQSSASSTYAPLSGATFSGNIILPQTGVLAFNSTSDEYIQGGSSSLYLGVDNAYMMHLDGSNDKINFKFSSSVNGDIHYNTNDSFALESTSYLALKSNVSSTTRGIYFSNTYFKPYNADNGALDLGTSSAKWKDLYLSGNITYSANNHILATNNSRNLQFVSGGSGSDVGLFLKDAGSTASVQLYGTASYHGFLDSAWGSWDLKKQKGGSLYLNNNTTYYLNPASTSNMYRATVTDYIYTPIVYDNNNSSYYVDPSSNSNLYSVNAQGYLYLGDKLYTNTGGGSSSVGQAGQVLTSGGTTNPVAWADAGGGAWEVIGNYTGTNVNSVDFINGVNGFVWNNSTYKRIKLYGNLVGYSGRTVMTHFFPLVSNGSSGNVVPTNLVFYVTEFAEAYPEYNVSLTSSFQYIYQSNANNNNSGVMFQAQCGSLPTGTGSGIAMFTNSIGGTSFNSNKRKLDTTVTAEFDSLGLGTNKTFSWRVWVSHDYPSFYFYPRRISGETLSHGWTNQGIRVAGSNSSSNFNYDFTFLGLKP